MNKLFVVENIKTNSSRVFSSEESVAAFMLGRLTSEYRILICTLDKVISKIPSEIFEIRELLYQFNIK